MAKKEEMENLNEIIDFEVDQEFDQNPPRVRNNLLYGFGQNQNISSLPH